MSRLHIRLPDPEKAALERAATAAGMSLSAFVRHRLLAELTGEALVRRIVEALIEGDAGRCEKLVSTLRVGHAEVAAALEEHRQEFGEFRRNLGEALKQLHQAAAKASR